MRIFVAYQINIKDIHASAQHTRTISSNKLSDLYAEYFGE